MIQNAKLQGVNKFKMFLGTILIILFSSFNFKNISANSLNSFKLLVLKLNEIFSLLYLLSNLLYSVGMSYWIGDLGNFKDFYESLIDLAEEGKVEEAMNFLRQTNPELYLKQGKKLENRLINVYKEKLENMKVKSIKFLNEVKDVLDAAANISVKLEDGLTYFVVVATTKYLLTVMDGEKSDFLPPGKPMIIVKKLTQEVIEKTIEAYVEDDAFCLKLFDASLDVKTLDVLRDRYIARSKFQDYLIERGESLTIENYDLIDLNIENDSKEVVLNRW